MHAAGVRGEDETEGCGALGVGAKIAHPAKPKRGVLCEHTKVPLLSEIGTSNAPSNSQDFASNYKHS